MKREKRKLHQRTKILNSIRIRQRIILASTAFLLTATGTLVYLSHQKPHDSYAREATASALNYTTTDIHLQNRILRASDDIIHDQQHPTQDDSIQIPAMPSRSAVKFKRTTNTTDIN